MQKSTRIPNPAAFLFHALITTAASETILPTGRLFESFGTSALDPMGSEAGINTRLGALGIRGGGKGQGHHGNHSNVKLHVFV